MSEDKLLKVKPVYPDEPMSDEEYDKLLDGLARQVANSSEFQRYCDNIRSGKDGFDGFD